MAGRPVFVAIVHEPRTKYGCNCYRLRLGQSAIAKDGLAFCGVGGRSGRGRGGLTLRQFPCVTIYHYFNRWRGRTAFCSALGSVSRSVRRARPDPSHSGKHFRLEVFLNGWPIRMFLAGCSGRSRLLLKTERLLRLARTSRREGRHLAPSHRVSIAIRCCRNPSNDLP